MLSFPSHSKSADEGVPYQKPDLVTITTRMTHASSKLKKAEDSMKAIEADLKKGEEKLALLEKERADVQKAEARHKGAVGSPR